MYAHAVVPCAIDASLPVHRTGLQPHDLLRLRDIQHTDDEPQWVHEAWRRAPFAVVRRALATEGMVPVGLRGITRAQRYGTWAKTFDIEQCVAPEDLLDTESFTLPVSRHALPAFVALAALRHDARYLHTFVWGPTGSASFELATHALTVTPTSDLDLLIRVPEPLSRADALLLLDELQRAAQHSGTRVDAQLETPSGGIALAEYAAGKPRVLARSAHGPHLIDNPWSAAYGVA
ncbi:malonate decarboxylase holo-ACP synthase [Paraburkholderia megapolitana]|uniref:Phosphoribosyl-dephospho-CoA transferase n=1 Tax=Paraburkholderia megapolitana TaxID=420953 RepID=A0A1I3T340_9BURK|nr:malonate decarboxylase holo-ACP synthase [Paraburkholderia megapolitana]QDQ81352.1 malonate decarboxylase holo-ACP synthase [Paraburkholderia megapolitana]SFJ63907.1 phosphoribosyl-dephospho-CoA transferase [Paraburkholderia megapolitana]